MQELTIGMENTETYTVESGGTAPHLSVPVLATPTMIGMIEHCCMMITQPYLDDGEVTVGAHVCVSHQAPTYPGETLHGARGAHRDQRSPAHVRHRGRQRARADQPRHAPARRDQLLEVRLRCVFQASLRG